MELLVNNPTNADAVICMRWCITAKDRKTIVEKKVLSAHMLIVIARKTENTWYRKEEGEEPKAPVYNYTEVKRYLAPLAVGAVYHAFDNPGAFKIYATIVGSEDESVEDLRKRYLGDHQRDLIRDNGDFDPRWPYMDKFEMEVHVAEEFFAPLPSKREQWYFELWPFFRKRAVDQCNWRRRRIFGYTPFLMPLFLLVWWSFRIGGGLIVYLAGISQGRRDMNFHAVYNEKNYDFKTIYRYTSFWRSVFWKDKSNEDQPWRALAHPWLIGGIMIIARATFGRWATWGQFFGRFVAMYATLLAVVGLIAGLWMVCELISQAWRARHPLPSPEEQARLRAQEKKTALTELDVALEELSCQVVKTDSPPKLRTLKLKYQWLKAQVCRPYPKG